MRRVIDGKVFDTDTADRICQLPCSALGNDAGWHETVLYRTRKGRFFVAGRGRCGPSRLET